MYFTPLLLFALPLLTTMNSAIAQAASTASVAAQSSQATNSWLLTVDQTIALFVGLLQVLATMTIALVVYRQTTRLKRIEMAKQLNDAYNLVTTIALSRDENLVALDSIGRESVDEPIEVRRKRWCAFVWLVALENTYMMNKHQLVDVRYADQALKHQLELILADKQIFDIICERGYEPAFVEYCREIRQNIENTRGQSGNSVKSNKRSASPRHRKKSKNDKFD